MPIIAPSLLAADFLHLAETCQMLEKSEAAWLHLDIMDGQFVPNISFGIPVIQSLRKASNRFFDVHLMIESPWKYLKAFADCGADAITVHLEACPHLHRDIETIKRLGKKAGVAVNPHTPIGLLENILDDVDIVNLMSVDPGFGGQTFLPGTLRKIIALRKLIDERGLSVQIEIDGGVSLENAGSIVKAGATVLVAGSTVFKAKDPILAIKQLLDA